MPSAADSSLPPRIADYELLKLIGTGSYGDVWLARGVTSVFCAVKVVWRARFADVRPYEREFEGVTRFAAISLREPSQLALLHAGRSPDGSYFFYVMELADDAAHGREIEPERYVPLTLRELHHRRGRLPVAEVLALGVALARALATLHAAGLIHRDIKPSNVVLVGGVPKLADVGLVAAASEGLTFVGTEGYVPREGPGAPAADVYGLGKVLYEVATGLDRHDWPRLPPDLGEIPDRRELLELNEVLVRACEADAQARFPDAGALLDELLLLQAGKSVRRLRAAERRTTQALRVAAVLAIVAGITGTGMWLEHQRAAAAEAERDALARRRTYSGNLASAQRALAHDEFRRTLSLLQELAPRPGETDLRGFEWHALAHEAEGDPHEIIRSGGPAIGRLALLPDESLLAAHDSDRVLTFYDPKTRREIRRVPQVRTFAGFSPDGRWIVGSDQSSALRRWAVSDGQIESTSGPNWTPIAPWGDARVLALSDAPRLELHIWDFAAGREQVAIDLSDSSASPPWQFFRGAQNEQAQVVALACVRGTGSFAQFRLTHIRLGPAPEVRHLELGRTRPSAVGVDSRGAWATIDVTGELWRFEPAGWRKTAEALPLGTRKYVEFLEEASATRIVAHARRLTWQSTPPARGHRAGGTGT